MEERHLRENGKDLNKCRRSVRVRYWRTALNVDNLRMSEGVRLRQRRELLPYRSALGKETSPK